MNVRRHNWPGMTLGAALALICFCALVPGVAAVNVATGSFQIASVGETVSIPIVLDSASSGISGYRITVSLSNPSVATITAVAFPDWAGLNSASTLPAGQVVLQAVDLSQKVPVGGTGVLLGTLTVKSTATGSTGIAITPDPSMGVQTRTGELYSVSASPGTLTVGTPSSGSVPTAVPTAIPTPVVPTISVPTPGGVTPVVPATGVPTSIPTSGGSNPTQITPSIPSVTPVGISVPATVSPGGAIGVSTPSVIAPGVQPGFGVGKRYAVGNPGSFIGTRFGSGGTGADTGGPRAVTEPEATLKPGNRAYGITPPAGKFVRWYPAARWAAGIK